MPVFFPVRREFGHAEPHAHERETLDRSASPKPTTWTGLRAGFTGTTILVEMPQCGKFSVASLGEEHLNPLWRLRRQPRAVSPKWFLGKFLVLPMAPFAATRCSSLLPRWEWCVADRRNHSVPRAPETKGARGTNKASLWPPRTLIARPSLGLVDAVLEFKYLKCVLVRTIFALVSIAKRLSYPKLAQT